MDGWMDGWMVCRWMRVYVCYKSPVTHLSKGARFQVGESLDVRFRIPHLLPTPSGGKIRLALEKGLVKLSGAA